MQKAIPYYRVSTLKQGKSGLSLEAQEEAVKSFASLHQLNLSQSFVEVETAKKNNRPVLIQALKCCQQEHAVLLIAKLDRLGRNVAFISRLIESKVDFIAVDNPTASKLILHIMAAFAEHERDEISTRTKVALAAAKKRGTALGVFGSQVLSKRNKEAANLFALKMQPVIEKIKSSGIYSLRKIAKELNKKRVKTFTGRKSKWHVKTVHDLIKRINTIHHKNQHI